MSIEGWITLGVVVVVLGIAFMAMFKVQISSVLSRLRAIDRQGVRIDPVQQDAVVEKDPRLEAEKLIQELDSTLIREVEDNVTKEFTKRSLSGDPALRVAIRYASAFSIALDFERIYRLIWGSQLSLLSYLNTERQHHPREALRPFYTLAASQYPEPYEHMSYDQWLAFLLDSVLLREDNGQLCITVKGCEFITHLAKLGYTLNKVG